MIQKKIDRKWDFLKIKASVLQKIPLRARKNKAWIKRKHFQVIRLIMAWVQGI